jgi:hypothetical protein
MFTVQRFLHRGEQIGKKKIHLRINKTFSKLQLFSRKKRIFILIRIVPLRLCYMLHVSDRTEGIVRIVNTNILQKNIKSKGLLVYSHYFITLKQSTKHKSGFGGLVVSMLASGTQDHEFEPGRSRRIFRAKKIHSIPSFGREVKPFAPCRRFAECQRTL